LDGLARGVGPAADDVANGGAAAFRPEQDQNAVLDVAKVLVLVQDAGVGVQILLPFVEGDFLDGADRFFR